MIVINKTLELIDLIGTPYSNERPQSNDRHLELIYKKAFIDRVALLYLSLHRRPNWAHELETLYSRLKDRMEKTLAVITGIVDILEGCCPTKYAIFKSLKPYPATPNDTDVIIFGNQFEFEGVIECLYSNGFLFHEWAPMQTTLIHPDGKGKTGKGKKGGTYYIDFYSEISTDYFLYIDKRSLIPYIETIMINRRKIPVVSKEIDLAIILFHNVFPERTFQLEHFYMPLYYLKDNTFSFNIMVKFAEEQKLAYAIAANLTIVEYIHKKVFGFVPERISQLLDNWQRNDFELDRVRKMGEKTPYMFSPKTFWMTFLSKIQDNAALKSIFVQGFHMLNPVFFMDVIRSLRSRLSEKGTYHLE